MSFFFVSLIIGLAFAFYGRLAADERGSVRYEAVETEGLAQAQTDKIVTAAGVGKITENTQFGRMMARRAALTDARRNMLTEARKIKGGVGGNVSGYVGSHSIISERIDGNLYKVEIEALLENLHVN